MMTEFDFVPLDRRNGIPLRYANRHGLITGATGTGKTVSLMRLAEGFSKRGVPVFVADVKGDIAALARSRPVQLLDLYGEQGQPIKVTPEAMGADLLARALELNDAQAGALEIAFAVARDKALPLRTVAELRIALAFTLDNRETVARRYGQVTPASVGVIMRALLRLEAEGADKAFGAPGFDVAELVKPIHPRVLQCPGFGPGDGRISILAADRLLASPRLYSAFLLATLSELYRRMPEIGDTPKPRLVLFFDEAHLLFDDAPAALLRRIEQTVRLIRSKGVGVYFATQSPDDVPRDIAEQLAHRIEHDRKLGVGTARIRTINGQGMPVAFTTRIEAPECELGALTDLERAPFLPAIEHGDKADGGLSLSFVAFLSALCLCGLGALGWLAWWIHAGNRWQVAAGIALAFLFFARGRLGAVQRPI